MPVPQAEPQPAVGINGSCSSGATGGLRIEERSGSLNSPYLISCTREKPSVMTVMFDVTTSSPKRPNFFWYCFLTVAWNCLFGNVVLPEEGRDAEERAEERVALHAQLQFRLVRRLSRDVEPGQDVNVDVVILDELPVLRRDALPGGLWRCRWIPRRCSRRS